MQPLHRSRRPKLFDLVVNKALKVWFAEARPLGEIRDPQL